MLDPEAPAERSAWFLPGIRSHEQAPSLLPLWEPLAEQLRALDRNGQDVIVDAGRLGLVGWPQPLIAASDLTLLVTRNSLPALAGARSWAKALRDQFAAVGGLSRLGAPPRRRGRTLAGGADGRARGSGPTPPRHIAKALQIPVVASVDWDPEVAEVYSHGARKPRKFESSGLLRSYRAERRLHPLHPRRQPGRPRPHDRRPRMSTNGHQPGAQAASRSAPTSGSRPGTPTATSARPFARGRGTNGSPAPQPPPPARPPRTTTRARCRSSPAPGPATTQLPGRDPLGVHPAPARRQRPRPSRTSTHTDHDHDGADVARSSWTGS